MAEPLGLTGPAAKAATALGLETVGDLLEHLPHTHRDRRETRTVASLGVGEEVTVAVTVRSVSVRPMRNRRKMVEAKVADETGPIAAVWFNQPWLARQFGPGTQLLLHGKLHRRNQFRVSEHELLGAAGAGVHTLGLVPVYPASQGITAERLRSLTWDAYDRVRDVVEPLPGRLRAAERLAERPAALATMHFPDRPEEPDDARRRLAFEELFLLELALAGRKRARAEGARAVELPGTGELVQPWLEKLPFTPTGDQEKAFARIDRDLASVRPMQRLLMGEVGSGKAQPMHALVLTPQGFKPMRDIRAGDRVVNPTGVLTRVTGVFPQGVRDVWRVRFSDDSTVECDLNHLWRVQTSTARHRRERPKVMSLREIAADLRRPSGAAKWHVELPSPVDLDCRGERPVDPYLVGLLLGDGSLTIPGRVRFTSADEELIDAVREALPRGCRMSPETHRPYDWNVVGEARPVPAEAVLRHIRLKDVETLIHAYHAGASHETIAIRTEVSSGTVRRRLLAEGVRMRTPYRPPSPLAQGLESIGLMGKGAREKSVPSSYLNAPISVRHAVLQGLLDTDGTVKADGFDVSFSSSSQQLAEDVAWLVRSLGGRSRVREQRKASGRYWRAGVALPPEYPPFRLGRKASRVTPRTKYSKPAKAIVAVEYVGRMPVQCISVAHENQLYVTDGFTITHNTVVALGAMLRAAESGGQAAFMAPTETLAEQHLATIDRLLGGLVPVGLLTGATPARRRRELLERLASGELGMIVGTHALIEPTVEFRSLALVVVDEQHRFGVRQRAALDAKGREGLIPHALHMTATPIPRTLALTAYGDLDVTILRELPAGRRPVETHAVDGARARARAYERIREEIAKGRQCFVVCPLVEESETLQAKAATAEAERLAATEFRDLRVELIHGQMPSKRKQAAMAAFAAGEADVLVATSVIEVGIDVPNATVMLIEAAERYGISQLHQLRGRIGRGEHESLCVLFGDPSLPRLDAVAKERDGFKLAEVDLRIRGAGEVLGTRQHGMPEFKVARLPDDVELLERASDRARELMASDPRLEHPENALLREATVARFGSDMDPIPA